MSSLLLAATIAVEFLGPCSSRPLLKTSVQEATSTSVGEMTITTLEQFKVPYAGTHKGLHSAFGTPTGMEALEILSPTSMRSYGWCYEIDGMVPEMYPDEVALAGIKKVTWFYAYALYKEGQWVSQCEPAHKIRPEFLCKN
jgi:hypothetical protein